MVEVTKDYTQEPVGPFVWGDLPAYESPASGLMIEGRAARREDLRRSGCREWEGIDSERKEAAKRKAYIDQKIDQSIDTAARKAYYSLSPEKQRLLRGG